MKLLLKATYSPLSLGQVGMNFTRELIKQDVDLGIFPIGDKVEFRAFDQLEEDVRQSIIDAAQNRYRKLDKNTPSLAIWHINGSENRVSPQYLYTFYETDAPTVEEISIVNSQEHTFFSSSYSAQVFRDAGCNNVSYVPLGVDPDLIKEDNKGLGDDVIHFGLVGKFEKRKNTKDIIQLWLKKFGNNSKYQLSCLINNPFLKDDVFNQLLMQTLEGKNWSNINFLPRMELNSQVNELYNAIDIDLSGISNGEGFNLPAFNATSLGKWSIVSNCSAHRDWSNNKNSILIEPEGKQECYDDFFFKRGQPFNQGNYFKLRLEDISTAMDDAVKRAKTPNFEGERLREQFTYKKSIDQILKVING